MKTMNSPNRNLIYVVALTFASGLIGFFLVDWFFQVFYDLIPGFIYFLLFGLFVISIPSVAIYRAETSAGWKRLALVSPVFVLPGSFAVFFIYDDIWGRGDPELVFTLSIVAALCSPFLILASSRAARWVRAGFDEKPIDRPVNRRPATHEDKIVRQVHQASAPSETKATESLSLSGVGGWLLFLIVILVFGAIGVPSTASVLFREAEEAYPGLATIGNWITYKQVSWTIIACVSALLIASAYRLWKLHLRESVRFAIIVLWVTGPGFVVADSIAIVTTLGASALDLSNPNVGGQLMGRLLAVCGVAVVWTTYLVRSKRVKNTYRDRHLHGSSRSKNPDEEMAMYGGPTKKVEVLTFVSVLVRLGLMKDPVDAADLSLTKLQTGDDPIVAALVAQHELLEALWDESSADPEEVRCSIQRSCVGLSEMIKEGMIPEAVGRIHFDDYSKLLEKGHGQRMSLAEDLLDYDGSLETAREAIASRDRQ